MLRPGSLVSRLLAASLFIMAAWLVAQLLVHPVVSAYRATGQEIVRNQNLLKRYRELAAKRLDYLEMLDQRRKSFNESSGFLAGDDEMLAAAALQTRVGSIIKRSEGNFQSTQVLPSGMVRKELGIKRIQIRIKFTIGIVGLVHVLDQIETTKPSLFIEKMDVAKLLGRASADDPSDGESMDVSLVIYGFLRSAEHPAQGNWERAKASELHRARRSHRSRTTRGTSGIRREVPNVQAPSPPADRS